MSSKQSLSYLTLYFRGAVKLELRCPQNVGGIAVDPQPDWSLDTLLSEITAIEKKLNPSSLFPAPLLKTNRGCASVKDLDRSPRAFIMRVSDDEVEDLDEYEDPDRPFVVGRRFACDELYTSDSEDYEDGSALGANHQLMNKVGLVEGVLSELNHEHQLTVTEEIRNQILALETDLMNENEKFSSALARVEKSNEARRDMDRKLDMQYQRRIAEALDNHLTAVQRDHEHKSQIEERRIRDDAAYEEAKRKDKAHREEKVRQQKLKAEMEARLEAEKKRAEEAKAAALDAERKATKDAAEKAAAALVSSKEVKGQPKGSGSDQQKKVQSTGNILKGAESSLKLEERRSQIYKEVVAKNEALGLGYNKEHRSHAMQIARRIKTITGTKENVRAKADELIKLFSHPQYPQSICITMFAEKLSDIFYNEGTFTFSSTVLKIGCAYLSVRKSYRKFHCFSNAVYAYGHVIVLVTSQVPLAMEIFLAELNRACIYTVPKYISYSESAFETKEAYYKAIGYQEEDGKIESTESYVARLSSYMKLYGALVQTEAEGVKNLHGIREGWAWFARFLNNLPANLYTAVALEAFLQMAGFALYKRYRSQFKKILNIISGNFLKALRERGDERVEKVVMRIQSYIDSNEFLKEPEGWRLQGSLLSHQFVPESDHQEQYYHQPPPSNRYSYQRFGN